MHRYWMYQSERFPLRSHGPVIAAFSASAIAFSAVARHGPPPACGLLAAGFASSLCFFLQLRIADEWKDAADDAAFRPYRPVPRGLVSLRELAGIGAAAGVVQLAVAAALAPSLLPLLLIVWTYFALMSREFFVRRWLRSHPVAYILSHMTIVPLIDAYVSSFDWLVAGVPPPSALAWFLLVSFCNGLVVEIGRKIRAPHDEERGVETYSALWGRARATWIWCTALAATALLATSAAGHIGFAGCDAPVFALGLVIAAAIAASFLRHPMRAATARIETFSGAWTIVMYLTLGVLPLALRGVR
jgi:4-hydroxybenzoate polyprenyltransferase